LLVHLEADVDGAFHHEENFLDLVVLSEYNVALLLESRLKVLKHSEHELSIVLVFPAHLLDNAGFASVNNNNFEHFAEDAQEVAKEELAINLVLHLRGQLV